MALLLSVCQRCDGGLMIELQNRAEIIHWWFMYLRGHALICLSWPKCSCHCGLQLVIRFIRGNNLVERSLRGHFRTFITPTVPVYTKTRTIRLACTVGPRQPAKALENSCTPPGGDPLEVLPKAPQRPRPGVPNLVTDCGSIRPIVSRGTYVCESGSSAVSDKYFSSPPEHACLHVSDWSEG